MRKNLLRTAVLLACAAAVTTAFAEDKPVETTTVGGRLFIDFSTIDFKNDGVKQPASGTGLDVKRAYIIIGHTFDEIWSANITTDFNYSSSTGETQLFIKKAYVQAKLSDAFFARAGSAETPWAPYIEDLYGYRYVEKVLVDRTGYGTTADWGLHAGGKVADGFFNYAVSAVNGNGYKNPTRSKSVDFEGRAALIPIPGLTLAVGFYSGDLGLNVEGLPQPNQPRGADRFDAFAGYVTDQFRVGAEYFQAKDWKVLNGQPSDKADGFSGWGSFNFTPMWAAFARYDQVKPNKDTAPNKKDTYYNAGVAVKPRKNLEFAFVYKHEEVENGAFKTADVTLGTQPPPATVALSKLSKYDEIGVWALVNF